MFTLHPRARQVGKRQSWQALIILRNPKGQCISYQAGKARYHSPITAGDYAFWAAQAAIETMAQQGIEARLA
jgi:hypothetical protein